MVTYLLPLLCKEYSKKEGPGEKNPPLAGKMVYQTLSAGDVLPVIPLRDVCPGQVWPLLHNRLEKIPQDKK